ncbi:MAG TPA: hypothetical protein VHA52_12335 [Candidatus Babeliaceae bacterium]|nr:hypothetical protein [Candidatus Babeliaceae bacterium]
MSIFNFNIIALKKQYERRYGFLLVESLIGLMVLCIAMVLVTQCWVTIHRYESKLYGKVCALTKGISWVNKVQGGVFNIANIPFTREEDGYYIKAQKVQIDRGFFWITFEVSKLPEVKPMCFVCGVMA